MAPTTEASRPPTGPRTRSRRRWWIWLSALATLAVVTVVVLVVFQPQKLFIDDKVDEAVPVATGPAPQAPTEPGAPPTSTSSQPTALIAGTFISRDHGTSGSARVLDVGGTRYLRIEDLDTDNGPALYVYLTANPANGPEEAFDDDIVDLGSLKGNVGNQNYELPADVDLTRYKSVVIWCDRFDAAFGAADLA